MYSSIIFSKATTKNNSIAPLRHAKNIATATAVVHKSSAGDSRHALNIHALMAIAVIVPIKIKIIQVICIIL